MNIQIFGTTKCFDTKKAERYFKERGIRYQFIDMKVKGMSKGEFNCIKRALGGYEAFIDFKNKDTELVSLMKYLAEEDREEKLFENQKLIKTPIVRNQNKASVGYHPEIWKTWE